MVYLVPTQFKQSPFDCIPKQIRNSRRQVCQSRAWRKLVWAPLLAMWSGGATPTLRFMPGRRVHTALSARVSG